MDHARRDRFIELWGQMGSLWGLNPSLARIHALLLLADRPASLDAVARELAISRGNASMCLKELRRWGVVRRVKKPGERKDYYLSEPDVWKMFFAIARERKRREFDPLLEALADLLGPGGGKPAGAAGQRMRQMQELLGVLDAAAGAMLSREREARAMLAGLAGRGKGTNKT